MSPTNPNGSVRRDGHGHQRGRCTAVRSALVNAIALEELADGELAHAEACPDCGTLLTRYRELAVLTSRTRRALEQTRPTLDARAWERIREAVERDSRRSFGARVGDLWNQRKPWFIGVFAVATAAIVLFALRSPTAEESVQRVEVAGGSSGAHAAPSEVGKAPTFSDTPGAAAKGIEAPAPAPSVAATEPEVVAVVAVLEGGQALELTEGGSVVAVSGPRTLTLYGRHVVEVSEGASLKVVELSALGIRLEVERGVATFEVNRAQGEAPFRVAAGDVTVEVRGTVFSVGRRLTDVTVSVERGRVAVMRNGQGAEDEVEVSAGERVVFPTVDVSLAPTPSNEARHRTQGTPRKAHKRPTPERMVEVEVGHAAMKDPRTRVLEPTEVSNLIPAILGAVRAGRCVQALNALDQISQAVDGKLPRRALWLTAYCQRQLGNLERSRALFARYGTSGPWAVPSGDELPPLP
jgi:hypothetical protein